MSKARGNQERPLSELNAAQIVTRIKGLRGMCDGYQEKIDLILVDGRGGNPTRQLVVRLRTKKAGLEKEIKALRRRLDGRRGEVIDARDSN